MTGRAAALQGGLAALGLITAHFTWQREPERAPGEAIAMDASKSDLAAVHYEDDDTAVDLKRGDHGGDPVVWLKVTPKKKEPDPKAKDKTPPKPLAPARELLGSEGATRLYERFAPLVSPRAFGVVDAAKLKELGLDAPKRKLTVTARGDTREYQIGQPPSTTSGESFMRDTRDGRVYLTPRGLLSELQNASHLVDRTLHKFGMIDYDRIAVTAKGKKKEFVHLGKENVSTEGFASAKTPDKRDQMAKNWHDLLWRTFPVDVLAKGENPPEGAPQVLVRVEYFDGKKLVGWLEIGRTEPSAKAGPTESTPEQPNGPQAETYVRSEHTIGWAKLHSNELIADAEKLVAN